MKPLMNQHKKSTDNHCLPLNRSISLGLLLAVSLSACQPAKDIARNATESDDTSIDAAATQNTEGTPAAISTKTEFPRYINGVPALLHPITPLNREYREASETALSSIKSRKGDGYQPIFEHQSTYHYRTHASNFVFEAIATGATQKLMPNNNFIISNVFIPYITEHQLVTTNDTAVQQSVLDNDEDLNNIEVDADRETQKLTINVPLNHFIYHIFETPNEADEKGKNIKRQQALYMSNKMGAELTKLHPDNEFVRATKWMPQVKRYYFITQSDSDGNGIIDEKDAYHNYQIDFEADKPIVKGYDFNK